MAQHIKVRLPNGFIMQFGESVFTSASDIAVEVPVADFTEIVSSIVTPESYGGVAAAGENVMFCDKAITAGQVTVERRVTDAAASKFSYKFIGR